MIEETKLSNEDVFGVVNSEGLSYALTGYLGPAGHQFEDEKLGELWDNACRALQLLEKYLDEIGYEPQ